MGLNQTPSANRLHIGIFGRRNAGKSSVINAITGQNLAIVSEVKGTTTDPVYKSMELLPLGPVVLIDTPGMDDEGLLGEMRIKKAMQVLNKTDVALLVLDATQNLSAADAQIINACKERKIPHLIVWNKCDLLKTQPQAQEHEIYVSAQDHLHIEELKGKIAAMAPVENPDRTLVRDLLDPGDFVVLVTPIDAAAPKGRLILPQQQTIRDILQANAIAIVTKEFQLAETLSRLGKKPRMVITDSQAFAQVAAETPEDIPLTSFSILFARYKGLLGAAVAGAAVLDTLNSEDKVLICEGCTHHRQCGDIGTVKLPMWIRRHSASQPQFDFTSGSEFPDDLSKYKLVIHCGGCMLNDREMRYRLAHALAQQIPITNYGIAIAHMQGILKRSIALFPSL